MNKYFSISLIFLITIIGLNACETDSGSTEKKINSTAPLQEKIATDSVVISTNHHTTKIQPPVNVDYEILGIPTVGEPLELEFTVSSSIADVPIQIDYRVADSRALRFMSESGEMQSFKLTNTNWPRKQKVIVIPQQEGRNHLVVTTRLKLPGGDITNSQTITIQVGDVPIEKQINGQITEDENGEVIISMPAN